MADRPTVVKQPIDASAEGSTSPATPLTVRDLRRRWKPAKEWFSGIHHSHSTAIRVHRAFSWLARVEQITTPDDLDLVLICRWVAFNSLYGQWNERTREPMPDRDCWRRFLDRVLALDKQQQISKALIQHRRLAMALLDDEYLSGFFWQEPSNSRAGKSKRAKYDAQTGFLERRWIMLLDHLIERIYLMRCQLMHGAETFGGTLNRDSLGHCSIMLGHLIEGVLLVIVDHGADEEWGTMCYPPIGAAVRRPH